ncbi:MucR family transcriptional regulator [Mesorhizobium humile]|uniref:MucR family transcriptional regulator n=1 Tax=Mesorhizobium humile TaxID=3072313 RepID=UPI003D31499B
MRKSYKSQKRHLAVHYGLTPDEYREKSQNTRWLRRTTEAQRSSLAKAAEPGPKPLPNPPPKSSCQAQI